MSKFKKHLVIDLPTSKRSKVVYNSTLKKLIFSGTDFLKSDKIEPRHLYVLDRDVSSIKKGDYAALYDEELGWQITKKPTTPNDLSNAQLFADARVVASTDPNLTRLGLDGHNEVFIEQLPQPTNAFIQKYCDAGGISPVSVEYDAEGNLKVSDTGTIVIKPYKEEGRSREEVVRLMKAAFEMGITASSMRLDPEWSLDEWIDQSLE